MDPLTPQQRGAVIRAVRVKDTAPEVAVRKILHYLGYRYRLHIADLPGKPDIVFRKRSSVVFVNGCFWHGHRCKRGALPSSNIDFWKRKIDGNRDRDRRIRKQLIKNGWRVLTIWECETKRVQKLSRKLQKFLGP